MPYGGERNLEEVRKIERCVAEVMAKGHDKKSAIRICKSRIIGKNKKRRRKGGD